MTYTKNWRFLIINGTSSPVKAQMIQTGLNSYPVPSKWITLSNDQSIPWSVVNWGAVGSFPWPQQDYTGIFFYYDFRNPNNTIITDRNGAKAAPLAGSIGGWNKFSIPVDSNLMYYSDMHEIGHRVFHEMVNGYALGASLPQYSADAVFANASPSSKSQFCASAMSDYRWKNDREVYDFCNTPSSSNYTYPSSRVEHATLSWCMEKLFPEYCKPDDYNPFNAIKPITPPTPPPPPVPIVTKVALKVVTVNNFTNNTLSANVRITVASSAGTVYGVTNWLGSTTMTLPCGIPLTVTTVTPRRTTKTFTAPIPQCSTSYVWKIPVGV
jgi:hypothetical protein